MPPDHDLNEGRPMVGKRHLLRVALIWTAVIVSFATAWAAQGMTDNHRTARDLDQRPLASTDPVPSSDDQGGSAVLHAAPESDADRFFRVYMLPGAAVLALMIAITLVAIFLPKPKTE